MKAYDYGTPAENARYRAGWRRADAADRLSGRRCETCAHIAWPEGQAAKAPAPRCHEMAYNSDRWGAPVPVVTQVTAICDSYQRRPEPADSPLSRAVRARSIGVLRARLLDPTLSDSDRTQCRAQLIEIERRQKREQGE